MIKIQHPDYGEIVLDETPQYGIEKVMGIDPAIPAEGALVRFRLYDDDGEYCYGGVLTDDDEAENQLAALRYGEADYGATVIKVLRPGGYVQEVA